MTTDEIKRRGWLIFEVVSGSRAYGLNTATSDTDIRGVFVLPKPQLYSLEYIPQVSNETNDIVYYELKRFMELLSKNNPNMLEMLNIPDRFVLFRHPVMNRLKTDLFLSKLCERSFADYAYTQIKKAYGLEKKIMNPMEEKRKAVTDFCFVYTGSQVLPLPDFLQQNNLEEGNVGLSALPHLKDCYNLYYSNEVTYAGIARKDESNDVVLSSVPEGETPVALLYFNKDGYSVHCRKYREYQDWRAKRNEERYKTTLQHGKKYDSKNMMHVFRLLRMAKEIATGKEISVWRKDRDFLLDIKRGKYEYDQLVQQAEALKHELPGLYAQSGLPEEPDMALVNDLLIEMREEYYKTNKDVKTEN